MLSLPVAGNEVTVLIVADTDSSSALRLDRNDKLQRWAFVPMLNKKPSAYYTNRANRAGGVFNNGKVKFI